MPSSSYAEHRLMQAAAHGWKKPGGGPSKSVGKEFVAADKAAGRFQKQSSASTPLKRALTKKC